MTEIWSYVLFLHSYRAKRNATPKWPIEIFHNHYTTIVMMFSVDARLKVFVCFKCQMNEIAHLYCSIHVHLVAGKKSTAQYCIEVIEINISYMQKILLNSNNYILSAMSQCLFSRKILNNYLLDKFT